MGFRQESLQQSDVYRERVYRIGKMLIQRLMRPWIRTDFVYKLLGYKKQLDEYLVPVHQYTSNIIANRRNVFLQQNQIIPDLKDENMLVYK